MRAMGVLSAAFCLVAVSAFSAEAPSQPAAGRKAEILLKKDDRSLEGVLLGFKDGKFLFELESGQRGTVSISRVKKVTFGKAVGEFVRDPFEPAKATDPSDKPKKLSPEEKVKDAYKRILGSLNLIQLTRLLHHWTGRFEDPTRMQWVSAGMKGLLKETKKGDLEKNLRLGLAVLKIVQKDVPAAKDLLAALKRDYPDDLVLQRQSVLSLMIHVARANRPPRRLKPGPGVRPLRPHLRPEKDRRDMELAPDRPRRGPRRNGSRVTPAPTSLRNTPE